MTDDTTKSFVRTLVLDRRDFCSTLAMAAAGTFVASALPFAPALAVPEVATPETWFGGASLDDIAGNYPPYAEPIGYGRPQVAPPAANAAEFPYWV